MNINVLKFLHLYTRFIAKFNVHGEKNRLDWFLYTNNQYSSFSHHTHIKYKETQNKKHVNSKPKVLSNTMCRISGFRTKDIHRGTIIGHNNYFS